MKKVIAAGHICLDITPVFPDRKVNDLNEILNPGKLIEVGNAKVSAGGSVTNTGIGIKCLGGDVALMGKIGNDEFAGLLNEILNEYEISDTMIHSNDATSYSVVLAIPGIDRIFLHNPGANNTFCCDDIDERMLDKAAHFHFGYPPLMRSMYENDGDELVKLFKKVKAKGLSTSLDMAAVDPESDAAKADWKLILKRVIPYVDFFVPSIEELCFMLDRDRFYAWQKRAQDKDITSILSLEGDIKPLANMCMEMGAKVVLLKCGAPGMYMMSADKKIMSKVGAKAELNIDAWTDRELFERSYKPIRILSATGAGDTSIAAFIMSMLEGETPEECMQLAAATGALCVTAYDSLSGLRPISEIKEMIKAGWEKC